MEVNTVKKRILSTIIAISALIGIMNIPVSANDVSVKLNGNDIYFDVAPQIINDRTLVPLRAISEASDCDVYWDDGNKTVYISTSDSPSLTGNEAIELVKKELNKGEVISLDFIEKLKLKYSFADRGTYYIVNATATAYADGTIKYKVYKSNKTLEYLGQGSDWSWSEYDF